MLVETDICWCQLARLFCFEGVRFRMAAQFVREMYYLRPQTVGCYICKSIWLLDVATCICARFCFLRIFLGMESRKLCA